MSDENMEQLFDGISARVELGSEFKIENDSNFAGLTIILDLELTPNTPLPSLQFHFHRESNLVGVSCYFCHKERTFPIGTYINSTWGAARFKNDERRVIICSPFCPTLLPSEQRHLFAYDNIRYNSPYTENKEYIGDYNFKEPPLHEIEFLPDSLVWNKCYFCQKEETIKVADAFYLSWENLNFPSGETVRVCSQNCIPREIL